MSKIQWTEKTWNVTVGCSKTSEGCQKCYAIKDAHRMAGNPNPKISNVYSGLTERRGDRTEWTGQVKFIPERLEIPLRTRKPTMWFVNSMSDLFHESVTDEQLDQIFAVMALTPQHIYQCLTKRPQRMLEYMKTLNTNGTMGEDWPIPNVWLGVTVENQKAADERIPLLLQTPAAVRFLSCEPLLEEVDLSKFLVLENGWHRGNAELVRHMAHIYRTWVIVGGESGSKARPCDVAWIRSIVEQCKQSRVPCFVKQLGSNAHARCNGQCDLGGGNFNVCDHAYSLKESGLGRFDNCLTITGKGGDPEEWPEWARVREFPKVVQ